MSGKAKRQQARPHLRGLTLIELMVVVTVLLLLVAVSVPRIRPALESGRIREAGRQVNAYFAMAKGYATQIDRPAGVWIERSNPGSNAAFELFLAEVPEPYAGDELTATAIVQPGVGENEGRYFVTFPSGSDVLTRTRTLVNAGEACLIRFDFRGPHYRCRRVPNSNNPNEPLGDVFVIDGRPAFAGGDGKVPTVLLRPVPYQILRPPIKAIGRPMQLTGGSIVDLEFSGIGMDFSAAYPSVVARTEYPSGLRRTPGMEFAALNPPDSPLDDSPVVILFEPGGSVHSVTFGRDPFVRPAGNIHLLLGRIDGLNERAEVTPYTPNPIPWSNADAQSIMYSKNLADRENLWIAIGLRTGVISTSPNAWEISPAGNFVGSIHLAREFAQEGQSMGGL